MSWCIYIEHGAKHVVPVRDTREHVLVCSCWCCPSDDGGIVVHHSADGREDREVDARFWSFTAGGQRRAEL